MAGSQVFSIFVGGIKLVAYFEQSVFWRIYHARIRASGNKSTVGSEVKNWSKKQDV